MDNEQLILQSLRIVRSMSINEKMADVLQSNGVILALITLLSHKSDAVKEPVALIIGSLARISQKCRDAITENNLDAIVPLLSSHNKGIQKQVRIILSLLL